MPINLQTAKVEQSLSHHRVNFSVTTETCEIPQAYTSSKHPHISKSLSQTGFPK